ncbi:right-handed parallel beta-helix repeat-containing protein [Nonomuraea rhodomycinica]|uniref:Right-handed parallel beta-helix repeat-containing protein n=1 Tax=Nonomuraea rhodomycinica TaxID=1712872 RepID=A0A7Y6II03_9ACTN|nr:right-handed parallel beta-helix repeat-containing protein [Nonomuraea rhodomycinica]NUW38531.1 right-handed parallel beta-helix repeat-containing protein [Nonomuraea rhodomycinica]
MSGLTSKTCAASRAVGAAAAALTVVIAGAGAAVASASAARAAAAPVYYLDSVAGDDAAAGTSAATAWKTLAKASAAPLEPGSKLLLKRGGSWSGQLAVSRSGTASAPIVVDAYGTGAAPIVMGDDEACVDLAGNHIEVYHLQVGVARDAGRCSWAGIKVGGDDNVVERNLITGAAAGVYIETTARYTAVTSNDFVDNNHMSTLTPKEENANDDSGAFAVLVQGDDSNIGWNTISGSVAFSYDYGFDGAAVEIFMGSRNRVHHNLAFDVDTFTELGTSRNDDGTSNDPDGTSGNVFEYNGIYGPRSRSGLVTRGPVHDDGRIETNGPVLGTVFRNNTMHLPNADAEGVVCDASCTNAHLTLSQNIVVAAKKIAYAGAAFTAHDHNVFYGGQFQMSAGTANVRKDPKFDANRPLHLLSTSPAIGLGVTRFNDVDLDGVAVGQDGRIEAGAYEYVAAG